GEGLVYGPAFRGVRRAWRSRDADSDAVSVFAEVELPAEAVDGGGPGAGVAVHPALLDAAMHALALVVERGDRGRVPFAFTGVTAPRGREGFGWWGVGRERGGAGPSRVPGEEPGRAATGVISLPLPPPPAVVAPAGVRRSGPALYAVTWEPLDRAFDAGASGP